MRSMPSCCRRSEVVGTQMSPRPCLAMKLTDSGVTNCAAMIKSPSFSRSASSTTMTILPRCRSEMTDSMELNFCAIKLEQANGRPSNCQPETQVSNGLFVHRVKGKFLLDHALCRINAALLPTLGTLRSRGSEEFCLRLGHIRSQKRLRSRGSLPILNRVSMNSAESKYIEKK